MQDMKESPSPKLLYQNQDTNQDESFINVLVVDDDIDAQELFICILECNGVNVTAASSAKQALVAISKSVPDVIICDIGMPDIDGFTLIRQIRKMPKEQGGEIPAIAVTAYNREEICELSQENDFQDCLIKPFDPDELLSKINLLIKKDTS